MYRIDNDKTEFRAVWDNNVEINTLMQSFAGTGRLLILCLLAEGEKSVGTLSAMTGMKQSRVSQSLARLRTDGMVDSRREGKTVHYSILDRRALVILELLDDLFRPSGERRAPPAAG